MRKTTVVSKNVIFGPINPGLPYSFFFQNNLTGEDLMGKIP